MHIIANSVRKKQDHPKEHTGSSKLAVTTGAAAITCVWQRWQGSWGWVGKALEGNDRKASGAHSEKVVSTGKLEAG